MTTQNVFQWRTTFTNLAAGTYYAPLATGAVVATTVGFSATSANAYIDGDGFDHLEFRIKLVSGDVNNTLTVTIEADDGTTGTFEWDETMGLYNWITGAYGAASWVATNTTTRARAVAYNHNAKRWHIKLVVALGAAANNSGVIEIRGIKV